MKRIALYFIALTICIGIHLKKSNAQKTDTIFHVNGNALTGDFKKMSYGVVKWKMDGMGTISLEEAKINGIRSTKQFEIRTRSGLIYFGSMDTSQFVRKVNVLSGESRILLNIYDIVEIYPIKKNLWMRISGAGSLGFNYSKGSEITSIRYAGNLNYRKKKTLFELTFDDSNTFEDDSLISNNLEFTLAWQRILKRSWSSEVSLGASRNTELGNAGRYDLNLVGIKDISYNSWNRFYAGVGLNANRENHYDESSGNNHLVGVFKLVWKVYKYSEPKIWLDSNISFLPYLTTNDRYRLSFNLNPRLNLLHDDFKIGLRFYYTHDSKPPEGASSKSDYGINLELGYSFH